MIHRRDLLVGSVCLIAAGSAYALKPRRRVSLLGQEKLAEIVPRTFGAWSARDVDDLVAPATEGSLVAKLYGQTLQRVYRTTQPAREVMMLIAYGDTQSNDLMLHRPEVCYPAFGFTLSQNTPMELALPDNVAIPARSLVADAPGRRETIVYWSRLGEFLRTDGTQQRLDRLKTALDGYIADGLLARFSVLGVQPETSLATMRAFIPSLVMAVREDERAALIGTSRAQAIEAAAPV
jgi:EpsI family protein